MNKKKLLEDLKDKRYRHAFVSKLIDTGIPFQIKALREERGWRQQDLAEKSEMLQTAISRMENPDYGKLNLNTLKRIAAAFDIGLVVRFVPLSDLVKWELNLTSESLKVLSYEEESYFKEEPISEVEMNISDEVYAKNPNRILSFEEIKRTRDRDIFNQKTPKREEEKLHQLYFGAKK